jgi:hypothetical protein
MSAKRFPPIRVKHRETQIGKPRDSPLKYDSNEFISPILFTINYGCFFRLSVRISELFLAFSELYLYKHLDTPWTHKKCFCFCKPLNLVLSSKLSPFL